MMILFFFLNLAALAVGVAINEPGLNYCPICGSASLVYDNGTKGPSWAVYVEELETNSGQNNQGATGAWYARPRPIHWPRTSDDMIVIPYCC